MTRSSRDEIIQGYIEEVKTYIPLLHQGIISLSRTPEDIGNIEEVHRLVHTIKGASSMIGIYGLSHIAYQMEEALDDIISGNLKVNQQLIDVMLQTVDRFSTYCRNYLTSGVPALDMLKETLISYRRLRNLPENEDHDLIKELMESVPKIEGGTGNGSDSEQSDGSITGEPEDEMFLTGDDEPFIGFDEESLIPDGNDEPELPLYECDDLSTDMVNDQLEVSDYCDHGVSDDLLSSFNEEAEEHIKELNRALASLETTITAAVPMSKGHKELVRIIRRSVHTVKGAAAVIGLPSIAKFGHSFEDLLDWLYEGEQALSPEVIALLADSASLLERIVEDPKNPRTSRAEELVDRYRTLTGGLTATAETSPKSRAGTPKSDGVEKVTQRADKAAPAEKDKFQAPKVMPELLESFYEEAEVHLEELGSALNVLEAEVTEPSPLSADQQELVRKIRRAVHTVKGAAAVIGLSSISSFAHYFEDLLDWLYEETAEINPEIVSTLAESTDLLEQIVASPTDPQLSKVESLKLQYQDIMTHSSDPASTAINKAAETPDSQADRRTVEIINDEIEEQEEAEAEDFEENLVTPGPVQQVKTLRVGMERIDDLVNLTGELMIALSAFDQKMDYFVGAVHELETSRQRLRDIAKELELGYEVRSLTQIGKKATEQPAETVTLTGDTTPQYTVQAPESGETDNGDFEDFDNLELDRYSQLNLIIRQLNESVIDVGAINTQLGSLYSDFDGHLNRQRVILSELQNKMMHVRMTPMRTITNRMRRTIRDTARKLGKKIRLIIEGEYIELDRLVWDKITDPLMHLLRNAADHGIEAPALRQAIEKTPVATIKLAASREGNQVVIRISDDGAGLNFEAIRKKIKEMGLSDRAEELSEDELTAFIFQPGFSTRGKISEISGRGVGMDVVKENIYDLKGTVEVKSWKGKGTRFTIRIPLTLAAVRALLFTISGQIYAISLSEINEILRLDKKNFIREPENAVRIKNEVLPLYYLAKLLKIKDQENGVNSLDPVVLVVQSGGKRGALVIDSLVGQKEIVIKSTGSHLRYVKGISGVTIMGDGSVVPILNIQDLLLGEMATVKESFSMADEQLQDKPLNIMVVDDSVSIRTVVSRLMEEQGWHVTTAKDGVDALEKLRDKKPDFIVLDIEMPRMNGYEFLSAVRTQASYKDIPVAMLTSRTAAKHRDKAINLGAKGFIVKPYNDDEFINMVLELTERSAAAAL